MDNDYERVKLFLRLIHLKRNTSIIIHPCLNSNYDSIHKLKFLSRSPPEMFVSNPSPNLDFLVLSGKSDPKKSESVISINQANNFTRSRIIEI